MTARRRCRREPRPHRLSVRLSADELAAVREAADRDGLALGGWVADAAFQVATCTTVSGGGIGAVELRLVLGELSRTRTQLAKAGVLFNQAVTALNADTIEEPRLAAAAVYVVGRVRRVDEQVEMLVGLLP